MSDALEGLESLACATTSIDHRMESLRMSAPRAHEALMAGGVAALRTALGGRPVMVCMVGVPNDDENEFEEQPLSPDEQPDESVDTPETRAA